MSRIIVDVTQLVHWQGKLAGITRVMDELATRFDNDDPDARFVAWVKDLQAFCEVDLKRSLQDRGRGIVYSTSDQGGSRAAGAAEAGAGKVVAALRRAKPGLRYVHAVSPRLAASLESRARAFHLQGLSSFPFRPGDRLLIPWGEWWDPRFAKHLVALHGDGVGLVQIIHDVAPTIWPQFFEEVEVGPTDYNSQIIPIADLVLTVSKNTKAELVEWLTANGLRVPRVEPFRLGDDLQVSEPQRPTDPAFVRAGLQGGDYLLCVGTLEAKKNHALLYYAYKLAVARGVALPKLVVVGRRGYNTAAVIDLLEKDPEVRDKVVLLFDASDQELSWLYDHCLFTVLPSFHEGWGIPIAESLSRGVPCLCSNTSSMVEIAEGIVGHFSPFSSDELLTAIQAWLDPGRLEAVRARTATYRGHSWDESYRRVKALLASL